MPSFRRAVALLLSVTPGALAAQSPAEPGKPAVGPHVVVIGRPSPEPGSADLVPAERLAAPAADGADLLRQVNGVSAGRMGGRGLEPVVRGQSQNRVNVLLDGAFVFGACPNRMDPPTAFAAVDTWERVTVVKGVRSLLHGPGGSGGTVLFERDAAPAAGGWSFEAGAAGTNNGTDRDLLADLGWRSGATFARGRLQSARAGSYEDGDGATVRSAYDEDAATLAFGFAPSAGSSLEVSWDTTRARDVLYAGAGMDAPEEDAATWRIGYEMPAARGVLSFDAWRADVDHLMDNYSNRPLTAPMAMRVPSTSATTGARLQADVPAGDGWSLTVGVDFLDSNREAVRYQGPAPGAVTLANSLMWPDVTVRQTGLVVQGERPVGPGTLLAGLRYDHVDADAARAAEVPGAPMAMSPDQLYAMYYGRRSGDENEDNVSALVTWEQPLAAGTTLFAGASRTVRTADATERYLAANNPRDPTQRWIGNPGIAPETHRQADLGLAWRGGAWQATAAVFYDDVDDFIASDRARGQDGILLADGARVYRNVDARLYGLEGEARVAWGAGWRLNASAAWVRGDDTADDRPLYQVPPLNGALEFARETERWQAGSRLRWAARQDRADDDPATGSGLDAGETPGWAVLDLFAAFATRSFGEWRMGVDNVLDRTYAEHVNRANQDPFNPDPVRVNEPGLVAWVGWRSSL